MSMSLPTCPRCADPTEHKAFAAGIDEDFDPRGHRLNRPAYFDTDEDGHRWYMCPVCGLLWVPDTGHRNRVVELLEEPVHAPIVPLDT